MLSAYDEKGNLFHLLDEIPLKQTFTCPACMAPVRLKNGQVMRAHFAHVSTAACHFHYENESAEHLNLKAGLYQSLSKTQEIEIEKVLPALNQIADLMVNQKLAVEVQCSRLSEKRLQERTAAYHNHGFRVLWLLGENLWLGGKITSLQKQFLYFSQNMGFHYWELDEKKREIRLKYLIYEDWQGKLYWLTKSCSFEEDVFSFFRLPYQKQSPSSYQVKQNQRLLIYIQKQLMIRNPCWLKRQEEMYLQGNNLLARNLEDYFPQVRPIESISGFCQIEQDLLEFQTTFFQYYKKQEHKQNQILYPPAFYGKMVRK